ncbi:hypothetical protein PV327_002768 [Microctonus hyperodae]|uniref:AAA-ATPase-like domain-containing protein n=1 Tax=Microctonus hyperodae TaxID=165561 RepID=A0AA39FG88_MICHY|nr:hypothetical protein PV327_002768 [Microctonus hyperodae]
MSEPTQTSSKTKEVSECENFVPRFEFFHNRPDYVDKTMFIKELLSDGHVLITAPPCFGKTLNMDMVRRFIEIEVDDNGEPIELKRNETTKILEDKQENSKNFKYFKGKKIFIDKQFMSKHFGQYPTIFVDFRNVHGDTFREVLVKLREAVNDAFLVHAYLTKSSLWDSPGFEKETFLKYVSTEKSKLLTQAEVEKVLGIIILHECRFIIFAVPQWALL